MVEPEVRLLLLVLLSTEDDELGDIELLLVADWVLWSDCVAAGCE